MLLERFEATVEHIAKVVGEIGTVLQRVAVCCSALQCVAVRCRVLQCVTVCCRVLQCVAVCCSVLQCIAVHYDVSPCVAVCTLEKRSSKTLKFLKSQLCSQ